jgi:acetyltransferase-like isoleucine patch superfamily enzyme
MALLFLSMLLPWPIRRVFLSRVFQWKIHSTARIGFSFVAVDYLEMSAHAQIGNCNIIRNLNSVRLAEYSKIGTFNWLYGMRKHNPRHFRSETARDPALIIGMHTSITSRHLIDATNTVRIGEYSTIAGFRSQIITHGINIDDCLQETEPVTIGNYVMIGTGCIILKGAVVPNFCVVAAGSVVGHRRYAEYSLLGGIPASTIKSLDPQAKYFGRTVGSVE